MADKPETTACRHYPTNAGTLLAALFVMSVLAHTALMFVRDGALVAHGWPAFWLGALVLAVGVGVAMKARTDTALYYLGAVFSGTMLLRAVA